MVKRNPNASIQFCPFYCWEIDVFVWAIVAGHEMPKCGGDGRLSVSGVVKESTQRGFPRPDYDIQVARCLIPST